MARAPVLQDGRTGERVGRVSRVGQTGLGGCSGREHR